MYRAMVERQARGNMLAPALEIEGVTAYREFRGRLWQLTIPMGPPPAPRNGDSRRGTQRSRTPTARCVRPSRWPRGTFDFVIKAETLSPRPSSSKDAPTPDEIETGVGGAASLKDLEGARQPQRPRVDWHRVKGRLQRVSHEEPVCRMQRATSGPPAASSHGCGADASRPCPEDAGNEKEDSDRRDLHDAEGSMNRYGSEGPPRAAPRWCNNLCEAVGCTFLCAEHPDYQDRSETFGHGHACSVHRSPTPASRQERRRQGELRQIQEADLVPLSPAGHSDTTSSVSVGVPVLVHCGICAQITCHKPCILCHIVLCAGCLNEGHQCQCSDAVLGLEGPSAGQPSDSEEVSARAVRRRRRYRRRRRIADHIARSALWLSCISLLTRGVEGAGAHLALAGGSALTTCVGAAFVAGGLEVFIWHALILLFA
jgi:hypothetical protein